MDVRIKRKDAKTQRTQRKGVGRYFHYQPSFMVFTSKKLKMGDALCVLCVFASLRLILTSPTNKFLPLLHFFALRALLEFEAGEADEREQKAYDPKTDHHFGLRPPLIFKMMMQGGA